MHRTVSKTKNYLAQNVMGAEVENPALLVRRHRNNGLLFILYEKEMRMLALVHEWHFLKPVLSQFFVAEKYPKK